MSDRPTYTVTISRDANEWVAVVTDGLPEGYAGGLQFEHFRDIQADMRDMIADLTDHDVEQFDVQWFYDLGVDSAVIEEFFASERAADLVADWNEEARQKVIDSLSAKLGLRVLGELLGISHQRVGQLRHQEIHVVPKDSIRDALADITPFMVDESSPSTKFDVSFPNPGRGDHDRAVTRKL